ncbi:MAG: 2TM domain-containing protein, partial [Bacteroidota bacterium]
RAKKRVEALKGFHVHAAVYVIINAFTLINIYIRTLGQAESFWELGHFFTPLLWGIGLGFHAFKVYGFPILFGPKWEQKQIEKYMEGDRKRQQPF